MGGGDGAARPTCPATATIQASACAGSASRPRRLGAAIAARWKETTIGALETSHGDAASLEPGGRRVVLVDVEGNVLGEADKLAAHEPPGALHLAFSVLLYNSEGKVLLQQRAATKYHFPLVWANSCCSHPAPGEDLREAARRRLAEELGIEAELTDVGSIVYRAVCPSSGLVEHELDHVLVGETDAEPVPDPAEVADVGWYRVGEVLHPRCPLRRAPWLVPALLTAEKHRNARRAQRA